MKKTNIKKSNMKKANMKKTKISKEIIPEIRNPKDVFLFLYFDVENLIEHPIDYSTMVSSIVFFQYFRHFQVPLENISITTSNEATKYLQNAFDLTNCLYFEHKDEKKCYLINSETFYEFKSLINQKQISDFKTTSNSTIYLIFENQGSETKFGTKLQENYSKILDNITDHTYHDLYILNGSCKNASSIQYFTSIKKLQEHFNSYSDLIDLFDIIYPLYLFHNIPQLDLIDYFKNCSFQTNFIFDSLSNSDYMLGTSLIEFTQLFGCDLIPFSEVINRSKQIDFETFCQRIKIENQQQYDHFVTFLNSTQADKLKDLTVFASLLSTLQSAHIGLQTFFTRFLNKENLGKLSNLFHSLSDDQQQLLNTIIQSLYQYSPDFAPNVKKSYENIIIIASPAPFLQFFPYGKRGVPIPYLHKNIDFNLGSYCTSILLETIFIKPNKNGITQEQLKNEFNSLKKKFQNQKQELYLQPLILYMTNTFQQIPFFFREKSTPLESLFQTTDVVLPFVPVINDSKDPLDQYIIIPPLLNDLSSDNETLEEEEEDIDEEFTPEEFRYLCNINSYGIVYQNTEDKAFYQKFCLFFSKELKKEGLPGFFPFTFAPGKSVTENAIDMGRSIIRKADGILPIKWRMSFQTGIVPFMDYLDRIDKKKWVTIPDCIEKAAKRMKEFIKKHPIPLKGPSDQIIY